MYTVRLFGVNHRKLGLPQGPLSFFMDDDTFASLFFFFFASANNFIN